MKLTIKILLIALVVGAIAWVAITMFANMSSDTPPPTPDITEFEEHILQRVEDEIADRTFDRADKAYDNILDEISTEAAIIVERDGDEEPSISEEEEQNCRKDAFDAYAPIFLNHAKDYFTRSAWDEDYIDRLRARAKELLKTGFAERRSSVTENLSTVVDDVNDYHAAWTVVRAAGNCNTLEQVKDVRKKAMGFQRSPLVNCDKLRQALAEVPTTAKESYTTALRNRCNSVISKFDNMRYSSTEEAKNALNGCKNAITEYYREYGSSSRAFDSELDKIEDRLYQADHPSQTSQPSGKKLYHF